MSDTEFPRRICLDKLTPAETAIVAAQHAVEAAGGSPHLTAATQLLAEARARVADHVDGVPVPEAAIARGGQKPCPTDCDCTADCEMVAEQVLQNMRARAEARP